jgi:hypothetical protein
MCYVNGYVNGNINANSIANINAIIYVNTGPNRYYIWNI